MEEDQEVPSVSMDYLLEQAMHKDLGRRLQVGPDLLEIILDQERCPELEQDQSSLDRMVDSVASSWVNSSNFKVRTGGASRQPLSKALHSAWWSVYTMRTPCSEADSLL